MQERTSSISIPAIILWGFLFSTWICQHCDTKVVPTAIELSKFLFSNLSHSILYMKKMTFCIPNLSSFFWVCGHFFDKVARYEMVGKLIITKKMAWDSPCDTLLWVLFVRKKNSFFINLGYSHFFHSFIDSFIDLLFSLWEHIS